MCEHLSKIYTTDGMNQMLSRLLASDKGYYSKLVKRFTNVTGRTGGVLGSYFTMVSHMNLSLSCFLKGHQIIPTIDVI